MAGGQTGPVRQSSDGCYYVILYRRRRARSLMSWYLSKGTPACYYFESKIKIGACLTYEELEPQTLRFEFRASTTRPFDDDYGDVDDDDDDNDDDDDDDCNDKNQ
ncbi:hypothetical protein ElyMa_001308800 [Elysia marginata]|uniref:Uncharacterized protein n=1 Tax=Elysia marginata TaxID=1093978 RepID=A0AAV4IIV9_9GAST|nr:hypothetical protein ElyMa_001308800 [Elysia marginata]